MQARGSLAKLFLAVSDGNIVSIKKILDYNPQLVNQTDDFGVTPFQASLVEDHGVSKFLLDSGANILHVDSRGWTCLHHLCSAQDQIINESSNVVLSKLISGGCDLDARDIAGRTPLMIAATFGSVKITQQILRRREDMAIDAQDNAGNTALHHACNERNLLICRFLCAVGADEKIVNFALQSPADILQQKAQAEINSSSKTIHPLPPDDESFAAPTLESLTTLQHRNPSEGIISKCNTDRNNTAAKSADGNSFSSQFELNDDPGVVEAAALLLASHEHLLSQNSPLARQRNADFDVQVQDTGVIVCLQVVSSVDAWSCGSSAGPASPNTSKRHFSTKTKHHESAKSNNGARETQPQDGTDSSEEDDSCSNTASFLMPDVVRVMVVRGNPQRGCSGVLFRRGYVVPNTDGSWPSHNIPPGHEVWFTPSHVFDIDAPFCALGDEDFDLIFNNMNTREATATNLDGQFVSQQLHNFSHRIAVYGTLAFLYTHYASSSANATQTTSQSPSHSHTSEDNTKPQPQLPKPHPSTTYLCVDYQGSTTVALYRNQNSMLANAYYALASYAAAGVWGGMQSLSIFRRFGDVVLPLLTSYTPGGIQPANASDELQNDSATPCPNSVPEQSKPTQSSATSSPSAAAATTTTTNTRTSLPSEMISCVDYQGSTIIVRKPTTRAPQFPAFTFSFPAFPLEANPAARQHQNVGSPTSNSDKPVPQFQELWNSMYSSAVNGYVSVSSWLPSRAPNSPLSSATSPVRSLSPTNTGLQPTPIQLTPANPRAQETQQSAQTTEPRAQRPQPSATATTATPTASSQSAGWGEWLLAMTAIQTYWPAINDVSTKPMQEEPKRLLMLLVTLSTWDHENCLSTSQAAEEAKLQIIEEQFKQSYAFPTAGVSSLLSHFSIPQNRQRVLVLCHPKLTDKQNFDAFLRQVFPNPCDRQAVCSQIPGLDAQPTQSEPTTVANTPTNEPNQIGLPSRLWWWWRSHTTDQRLDQETTAATATTTAQNEHTHQLVSVVEVDDTTVSAAALAHAGLDADVWDNLITITANPSEHLSLSDTNNDYDFASSSDCDVPNRADCSRDGGGAKQSRSTLGSVGA